MSDDFHRPTYTSSKKLPNGDTVPTNDDGEYNPTQVRLYGIPGQRGQLRGGEKASFTWYNTHFKAEARVDDKPADPALEDKWNIEFDKRIEMVETFLTELKKYRSGFDFEKFAADFPSPFQLYREYLVTFETRKLGPVSLYVSPGPAEDKVTVSTGIMFGYAYEGHTYDFPKPKLMLLPVHPLSRIPKDDSGFDLKAPEGYSVWIVDKLEECVQIEMDQGFIEQLVLEANMPGKRSPTAYRAAMALAQRGAG